MRRREFMEMTARTLAASALAGCASRLARGGDSRATHPGDSLTTADYRAMRRVAPMRQGRIAYIDRGTGDAALFLHGFPLNNYQWRGAIARLSAHRRCIAPDFLAMGYTEVADGQSVAPPAQVEMVLALLDLLGISTVDIIANDSGGAVAQLIVAHHPERVRTLLLTNCDAEPDSPPPALLPVIQMAHEGTFPDRMIAPSVDDKEIARSANGLGGAAYTYPAKLADDTIDYYLAPLVSSPERKALANAYAIALEHNPLEGIEPLLKRCTIPVRIVWGTGDTIFSAESPDYLSRTFAGSRGVRRVPGAKLFFPEEYPDLIAEEARRLWGVG